MRADPDDLRVLVDTQVATWAWFARKSRAVAQFARFGDRLVGRTLVISGQTRAELMGLKTGRPQEAAEQVQHTIDALPYLPLDRDVQERYAELSEWGKRNAHPIAQKIHAADRWIAAAALQFGLPLATDDKVFREIPDLELIEPNYSA